jgi:hypothetical protein
MNLLAVSGDERGRREMKIFKILELKKKRHTKMQKRY